MNQDAFVHTAVGWIMKILLVFLMLDFAVHLAYAFTIYLWGSK